MYKIFANRKKGGNIMLYISTEEAKLMNRENYNYFEAHIDELCEKYSGKHVVIKDSKVIGVYDSFDRAYTETIKEEVLGTFLIQLCSKNEKDTASYFYSNNVTFAQV